MPFHGHKYLHSTREGKYSKKLHIRNTNIRNFSLPSQGIRHRNLDNLLFYKGAVIKNGTEGGGRDFKICRNIM